MPSPPHGGDEKVDILDQSLSFRIKLVDLTYDELVALVETLPPAVKVLVAGALLGLALCGVKQLLY